MIEVISPGIYTSIQDMGRIGYRKYGIPRSGAMDSYSAKLVNQILGNSANEALLEMTLVGPTLKFKTDSNIAITGANFDFQIDDQPIEMNKVVSIKAGQTLKSGDAKQGMRAYLGIEFGFETDMVLGSYSQYKNVTSKTKLNKGDVLTFKQKSINVAQKNTVMESILPIQDEKTIEVFKGPEFKLLSKSIVQNILETKFKISMQSNRMGYRLISDNNSFTAVEIITSPVQPGTVQLTPSGQIIILGKDAQTTGGYARVFQLTEKAQNVLAQKQLGSSFTFNLKN